jgi:hypothetical protein
MLFSSFSPLESLIQTLSLFQMLQKNNCVLGLLLICFRTQNNAMKKLVHYASQGTEKVLA